MRKTIIITLFIAVNLLTYAQEVNKGIKKDSLKTEIQLDKMHDQPIMPQQQSTAQPIADVSVDLPSPTDNMTINPKATEINMGQPYLASWRGGVLTGYHGSMSNILSFRNMAGINAYQQWGRLSMNGGLSLSKGIGNGIGIVNGIGANVQLGYLLSRNVSITAFGGIDRYGFMSPAPNASTAYYGGYMSLLTNNGKWGVDVGVRTVYNSFTGRWEAIPIAMPYYNLNGAKLGIDVGGLLYGIFSSVADKKSTDNINTGNFDPKRGPAIIAPPINTMPHFDPIETPKWVENQYKGK